MAAKRYRSPDAHSVAGRKREHWTASYLAFVLPLKPEDVLRCDNGRGADPVSRREWAWIDYAQRLVVNYGFDAALASLGRSPEPEAQAA